ncbi:MAG: hypothetical protein FWG99_02365 [Treponema sp.]|nr:hypothetical protein [Treponema sp.]
MKKRGHFLSVIFYLISVTCYLLFATVACENPLVKPFYDRFKPETENPTPPAPPPAEISVRVEPSVATVRQGGEWTFNAIVDGSYNQGVTWSLWGNSSPGTDIDSGKLTVGAEEAPDTELIIIATSVEDPSKNGSAFVTVAANDYIYGSVVIAGGNSVGEEITIEAIYLFYNGLQIEGPFSYQWKRNDTTIDGAADESYTIDEADAERHITVVVSCEGYDGNVTSNAIAIPPINALEPVIISISEDIDCEVGDEVHLRVLALSPDSGTLSYQWYKNDDDDNINGTPIQGATGHEYIYTADSEGTTFYYVEVTNEIPQNNDTGIKKASVIIGPIKVTVTASIDAKVWVSIDSMQDIPFIDLESALASITTAGVYTVRIGADQPLFSYTGIFSTGTNITLTANDESITITLSGEGNLFTVNNGVSLTLEDGVLLHGCENNDTSLIYIEDGGTFTMNGGEIYGNGNITGNGGGVYVASGTFNMTGGEIYGNMAAGNGGGVYVADGGTFIKNGGTIYGGYDLNEEKRNKAAPGGGHAVYHASADAKIRTDTATGIMNTNFAGKNNGWDPTFAANTIHPIYVENALRNIGTTPFLLGHDYQLMEDIDLQSVSNWEPIGSGTQFTGKFDGNGRTIKNLRINDNTDYQGMFGVVDDGTVINLRLEDVNINGRESVGGIAGQKTGDGSIEDCYVSGIVRGTGAYIGGIVGWNNGGRVENCTSATVVTGDINAVGGIAGYNSGIVTNCHATGVVTGNYGVGGVVGYNPAGGTVSNCSSTGNIESDGDTVGGVVGENKGTVEKSYATGKVEGNNDVGGVVGLNDVEGLDTSVGTVQNCYSTGDVNGEDNVGGVVGRNQNGSIVEKCYSTGDVNGEDNVGGVVGQNQNGSNVENCYSTGYINGTRSIGGVVGWNVESPLSKCYSTGTVSGEMAVGGVVGINSANGMVGSCVALNLLISIDYTTPNNIGRVMGENNLYLPLLPNYGLDTMEITYNGPPDYTVTDNPGSKDGGNITSGECHSASWWTTVGNWYPGNAWDDEIWDIADGRLPRLLDMPGGLEAQNPMIQD